MLLLLALASVVIFANPNPLTILAAIDPNPPTPRKDDAMEPELFVAVAGDLFEYLKFPLPLDCGVGTVDCFTLTLAVCRCINSAWLLVVVFAAVPFHAVYSGADVNP